MKNIRIFLSEKFPFLVVKFSIYLNRSVFVMKRLNAYRSFLPSSLEQSLADYLLWFIVVFYGALM